MLRCVFDYYSLSNTEYSQCDLLLYIPIQKRTPLLPIEVFACSSLVLSDWENITRKKGLDH